METKGKSVLIKECRMVGLVGDLFNGGPVTDDDGKPVLDESGQPKKQWCYMFAIPKSVMNETQEGGRGEVFSVINAEASALGIPLSYNFSGRGSDFSWKMIDGDSTAADSRNNPFNQRTGYAGHFVLTLSSYWPPTFADYDYQSRQAKTVNVGLNCGDYYQVAMTVKGHTAVGRGKAGMYLNIIGMMRIGHGEVISVRPDVIGMFNANQPVGLPQGASSSPLAPVNSGFNPQPQQQAQVNPFGAQAGGVAQPQQAQPHQTIFNPSSIVQPQQQAQVNPFGSQAGGVAQPQQQAQVNPFGAQAGGVAQPQQNTFNPFQQR